MKKAVLIFAIIGTVCFLSGCGEHYPIVKIETSPTSSIIDITIGKPYVYEGFDVKSTDGGRDLILHFKKEQRTNEAD